VAFEWLNTEWPKFPVPFVDLLQLKKTSFGMKEQPQFAEGLAGSQYSLSKARKPHRSTVRININETKMRREGDR